MIGNQYLDILLLLKNLTGWNINIIQIEGRQTSKVERENSPTSLN